MVPCFPLLGLAPSGLFMGLSSTLIYTSELILCSTICVPSATQHNNHMSPSDCHSQSSVALQERPRNCIAFPFLLCTCLVVVQPAVGLMSLPLHFLNFPIFMVFFQVSRPWKPTRHCGSCLYPNDDDVNFCQAFEVATAPVNPVVQ